MAITVTTLELGCVHLPDWHPRSADGTCLIQGYVIEQPDVVHLCHDRTVVRKPS